MHECNVKYVGQTYMFNTFYAYFMVFAIYMYLLMDNVSVAAAYISQYTVNEYWTKYYSQVRLPKRAYEYYME
jgi:hypothetical protein